MDKEPFYIEELTERSYDEVEKIIEHIRSGLEFPSDKSFPPTQKHSCSGCMVRERCMYRRG